MGVLFPAKLAVRPPRMMRHALQVLSSVPVRMTAGQRNGSPGPALKDKRFAGRALPVRDARESKIASSLST